MWRGCMGCDEVDGHSFGIEFVVTQSVRSVLYPFCRGLTVLRVWGPRCCGCVILWHGQYVGVVPVCFVLVWLC